MSLHRLVSRAGRDVYEHVYVAERALGRRLPRGAEVHHVDGDPRHNANRNLVICQDKAYHKLLHLRTRVVRAGGNPDADRVCSRCKSVKPLAAFSRNRKSQSGVQTACRDCAKLYWADRAGKKGAA